MQKTILLIEDNVDDEELTVLALQEEYKLANDIVVARDGEEAVHYLFGEGAHAGRDTTIQPQLILLDINLPKLNGTEVLRRIRGDDRTRFIPVVMLTTSREEKDRLASYGNGANSYIVKPVDSEQFMAAIRQLELYWLALNQPA